MSARPMRMLPDAPPQPVEYGELTARLDVAPAGLHAHFPWRAVQQIAGPLLPGRLYIVSARTGSGKTLFVRTLLEHWLRRTDPMRIAYWPTETPPEEIIRAFVASEYGVNPARIEEDDFDAVPGGYSSFRTRCANLAAEWCADRPGVPRILRLYGQPWPRLAEVLLALHDFADAGGRLFVLDHLLRLELDQTELYGSVSSAIRAIKQTCTDLGLIGIVTSQQNRAAAGGDRLAWFLPPDLSSLKGSGTIEEEADGVFFVHRVLRESLTNEERSDIRAGKLKLKDAIAPHLMGVAVGKARVDGSRVHGECRLWVEHGRVTDLPRTEALAHDAVAHGIRTNRDL